eukprot:jgi/Chlat1/4842/Chrsp31S00372
MEMTKEWLRRHCRDAGLYVTPALNDKLYLHHKGFARIANLEAYTGLKALFLEGNCISSLEGLLHLKDLACLYMQQNMLESLDGIEHLPALNTLNVSNNQLVHLRGVSRAPALATLQAPYNRLAKDVHANLGELAHCPNLTVLDLSHNHIEDGDALLEILKQIPSLSVLYLQGNPVVSKIQHYRKTLICALPNLKYLDDSWRDEGMRRREELKKAADANHDTSESDSDNDDNNNNDDDDNEPPELIAARARLANANTHAEQDDDNDDDNNTYAHIDDVIDREIDRIHDDPASLSRGGLDVGDVDDVGDVGEGVGVGVSESEGGVDEGVVPPLEDGDGESEGIAAEAPVRPLTGRRGEEEGGQEGGEEGSKENVLKAVMNLVNGGCNGAAELDPKKRRSRKQEDMSSSLSFDDID